MLELPKTIRIPHLNEVPDDPEIRKRINESLTAPIIEGFILKKNTEHNLPFVFYAEINVDNSRLWDVFTVLSTLLPEICCCVYNSYESEPRFGEYMQKKEIMDELSNYEFELTQDCDIEFGILFHSEVQMVEVFVSDSKYIRFWGMDESQFTYLMNENGLTERPEIKFIDEYPKVVVPLAILDTEARETEIVLQELYNSFGDANEK